MPERTPYIAANWKMNKTIAEAAEFVDALLPRIAATRCDVVICPSFIALGEVVERSRGSAVRVAAQWAVEDAGVDTAAMTDCTRTTSPAWASAAGSSLSPKSQPRAAG